MATLDHISPFNFLLSFALSVIELASFATACGAPTRQLAVLGSVPQSYGQEEAFNMLHQNRPKPRL